MLYQWFRSKNGQEVQEISSYNETVTESPLPRIQPLLAFAAAHPDEDLSLAALSALAGSSPFPCNKKRDPALTGR